MNNDSNINRPLLVYQSINSSSSFTNVIGKLLLINTSPHNLLASYKVYSNGDRSHLLRETQSNNPLYHVLTHSNDYSIESLGIQNRYFKVGSSMFDGYHGISNTRLSQSGWLSFVYDTQWEEFSRRMEYFNEEDKLISIPLLVSYL